MDFQVVLAVDLQRLVVGWVSGGDPGMYRTSGPGRWVAFQSSGDPGELLIKRVVWVWWTDTRCAMCWTWDSSLGGPTEMPEMDVGTKANVTY